MVGKVRFFVSFSFGKTQPDYSNETMSLTMKFSFYVFVFRLYLSLATYRAAVGYGCSFSHRCSNGMCEFDEECEQRMDDTGIEIDMDNL